MTLPSQDISILRELGQRKAEIGSLPVQKEKFELWRQLNRLEPVRPLVWINEIPWNELQAADDFLQPRCTDPFLLQVESNLRMELYQWDHFACDMIVEPVYYCSIVGGPFSSYADYGIKEQFHQETDGRDVCYLPVIHTEADADLIRTPEVWYDREATAQNCRILSEIFDGILPVQKRGIVHQWHSPWDQMIHWYGIEQLYRDMYDNPNLVHRILRNFTRALSEVLDRQQALGMLDVGNGNWRVGSGGMGITDELPAAVPTGHQVTPKEQWGCSTAQIFSEVSPDMHEEFALQYERQIMVRYGLTYYGCCDPLHKKVDMLRSIPNLRKVSMSPWIQLDEASEKIDADYVFSYKPNPAFLATDQWQPELVRNNLKDVLNRTRRNRREIILKDVSTIRDDAHRLDDWARIAMELVQAAD